MATQIIDSAGQLVWHLSPDLQLTSEQVYGLPGLTIYQIRPATAQDLAQVMLASGGCEHTLGTVGRPSLMRNISERHRFLIWEQLRDVLTDPNTLYPFAVRLRRATSNFEETFWTCYANHCVPKLLARVKLPTTYHA